MTAAAYAPTSLILAAPASDRASRPELAVEPLPAEHFRLCGNWPNKKRPKRSFGWIAAIVAAIALAAWQQTWNSRSSAAIPNAHTSVTIARPTQVANSNVQLPATFRPWQTTTLHARVSGYLKSWHHELGDRVKAGELLAFIETPELDQELAQAHALAGEADAAVVQAAAERLEAQADLKVSEAQLVRARAEAELAKSQLLRRDRLLAKQVITKEEFDTYYKDVEARSADVTAAKADVVRRQTNLDTRAATIKAREATAKSRRANVERLNELQVFKRIVAPFDGIVTRRAAEVGMLVTAGKESLFTVEDMSRVRVQVNVPQTYALQTTPGARVTVTVPESDAPPKAATITRVADSVDSASRTMLAEIVLDNQSHHYQPGSYAQVTLATQQSAANWTIPTNALTMRVDGPHIAAVNEREQVEVKPVSLGRDLGKRVVVVEGIHGNERLIVNPGDSLASGLQVKVNSARDSSTGVATNDNNSRQSSASRFTN
jgi:RND family efflux transporter MFP subunit